MTNAAPLTEHLTDWRASLQVDAAQRLVQNVALAGSESRNGYRYSAAALAAAAPLYADKPVFLDHAPDRSRPHERSTRDLVGSIVNPRFEEGRIKGDIRLLDTDSARTFLALVASDTPGVGMSHVVLARRSGDGLNVEAIEDVLSVDAVVNPATTTTFRESAEPAAIALPTRKIAAAARPAAPSTAEHADLCAEHAALSAERDSLTAELAAVRSRLADLESERDRQRQAARLHALLAESRLPEFALSPQFRAQLAAAPDDTSRLALIDERRQLLAHASRRSPTSAAQAPLDDAESPGDGPCTADYLRVLRRARRPG